MIDMTFRPDTYWPESLTSEQLISRIRGKTRQEIARSILKEEGFTGLSSFLAREELDKDERAAWGAIHPMNMGGEYLPALESGEVEFVRVSLASTTSDQISVRARRQGDKIKYRVVGEYEEQMQYVLPFDQSDRPLILAELVQLIDGSRIPDDIFFGGLVIGNWECGYSESCDVDDAMSFISISSPFYPELEAYYEEVAENWAQEHRFEDEEEEDELELET